MTKKVAVIGAGGHAKVVIDILSADQEIEIVGLIDRRDAAAGIRGYKRLGDDDLLPDLLRHDVRYAFCAVGDNDLRKRLAERASALGFQFVNAISPYAIVSETASLGQGVALMPGCVVNADACIGDHAIVNTGASVDHDCKIGAYTHLAPGCRLAGTVTTGEGAFLGVGAAAVDRTTVGAWSVVGAGAVVVRDVPDGCLAVGVPARVAKAIDAGFLARRKENDSL